MQRNIRSSLAYADIFSLPKWSDVWRISGGWKWMCNSSTFILAVKMLMPLTFDNMRVTALFVTGRNMIIGMYTVLHWAVFSEGCSACSRDLPGFIYSKLSQRITMWVALLYVTLNPLQCLRAFNFENESTLITLRQPQVTVLLWYQSSALIDRNGTYLWRIILLTIGADWSIEGITSKRMEIDWKLRW